jgi:hypothetical protein
MMGKAIASLRIDSIMEQILENLTILRDRNAPRRKTKKATKVVAEKITLPKETLSQS